MTEDLRTKRQREELDIHLKIGEPSHSEKIKVNNERKSSIRGFDIMMLPNTGDISELNDNLNVYNNQ